MKRASVSRLLLTAGVVALFFLFILPELLPKGPRWYVLNPRYALWRIGWCSYDQRVVYAGLNGDLWRDDVVRGKTVAELRTMFHDIRQVSDFDQYALAKVSALTNSTCTFVKWADTDWFIEIRDGRATSINLWKG